MCEEVGGAGVRRIGEGQRRRPEPEAERGVEVRFIPLVAGAEVVLVYLGVERVPGPEIDTHGLEAAVAAVWRKTEVDVRPDRDPVGVLANTAEVVLVHEIQATRHRSSVPWSYRRAPRTRHRRGR